MKLSSLSRDIKNISTNPFVTILCNLQMLLWAMTWLFIHWCIDSKHLIKNNLYQYIDNTVVALFILYIVSYG